MIADSFFQFLIHILFKIIQNVLMKKNLLVPVLLCLLQTLQAQVTTTYTNSGSWTVPAGVSTVWIRVMGGGAGSGGEDCGAGCGRAPGGPAGYIYVSLPVTPGDIIGIYPGAKGGNGVSNITAGGGGTGGVSTYSNAYNGGNGGDAGPFGSSGGGGGGGAASVVTINAIVRLVAGGAGGGGGMANSPNSGLPGSGTTSPNGTSTAGGNGVAAPNDGGGSGGGGGGQYGSTGGTIYPVGGEDAGNGGFRGGNNATGATQVFYDGTASWSNNGLVEITYGAASYGGVVSSQGLCGAGTAGDLFLTAFIGTSIQWEYSDDNSNWNTIAGANSAVLSSAAIGSISSTRYYRAIIDGTYYSAVGTIEVVTTLSGIAPSGSGSMGDPYEIASPEHLQWIAENPGEWDKHFVQTADIDMSATSIPCYNGGKGWKPIGDWWTVFTGVYDGQGHRISNLYLNKFDNDLSGLFGYCVNATLRNLVLDQIQIADATYITGALVAYAEQSTISRVGSKGTITNSNTPDVTMGGLVGNMQNSTMEESFSSVSMDNSFSPSWSLNTGGLSGSSWNNIFRDSYFKGSIHSTGAEYAYAGGISGNGSDNEFTRVYASFNMTVTANMDAYKGGISGENQPWSNHTFNNALFRADLDDNGGGTPVAAAQLKLYVTFFQNNFDLQCEGINGTDSKWGINSSDNNQQAFLSWEAYSSGCAQWTGQTNTTFGTSNNWENNVIPAEGMDIIISPAAASNLVLPQNWNAGSILFNGAGQKIELNGFNLTLSGTVSGADAGNYVQTNGSGRLRFTIGNGDAFSFPVGNSTYNPVTITNNSGSADAFGVRVLDEVYVNGSNGVTISLTRVRRTWDISKTGTNGGSGIDFRFNWQNGDANGPMATPTLYHYNTQWDRQTGSSSATTNSFSYTGYTGSFSPFMIAESSSTLPVHWLSFKATPVQKQVQLKWITAQEINTLDYVAEHSTDGRNWKPFATIAAAGQSNSVLQYSTMHLLPVKGINYYRILQRDQNGTFSYSSIERVELGGITTQLSVYPNPVAQTQLQVEMPQAGQLQLMDAKGQLLKTWQLAKGWQPVDLSTLPAGIYYLRTSQQSTRFVKQ